MTDRFIQPTTPMLPLSMGGGRKWFNRLASGMALALAVGCGDSVEITQYQVPRPEKPAIQAKKRLLAAIFPADDATWFFKFMGPPDVVNANAKEFEHFVHSVRFTGKSEAPVEWTVPANWRKGKENQSRYAAFDVGSENDPTEITVTKLGKEAGTLVANVNRWRVQQLGLIGISNFELDLVSKSIKVNGVDVTWVDMRSPET